MLTGLMYTLGWIVIPQLCWRASIRAGMGIKWRAIVLFASVTLALAGLSLYAKGPYFLQATSAFHDTYYVPTNTNYYQTLAIIYGVLAFVHIALNYARQPHYPKLATLQFWLLHIGLLLPTFTSWAITTDGTSLEALQTSLPLWNKVNLAGIFLITASALLLLIMLIGAVWSAPRDPRDPGAE